MSQKIKDLAKQSGINFTRLGFLDVGPEGMARLIAYEDFEKYSELLIKEVLQVARAGLEFGPSMEEAVEKYFEVKL